VIKADRILDFEPPQAHALLLPPVQGAERCCADDLLARLRRAHPAAAAATLA
jgi:hypothetical protein